MPEPSLRDWLTINGDWMVGDIVMALLTSSVVGWRRRSKGAALLMSHIASGVLAIFLFIVGRVLKYDPILVIVIAGPIGGSCSYAAFSFLLKLNDRLEVRGNELADKVIDRVAGAKIEAPDDSK